jgi:hypothetical protein
VGQRERHCTGAEAPAGSSSQGVLAIFGAQAIARSLEVHNQLLLLQGRC